MKINNKGLGLIVSGLALGIIFSVTTGKFLWYVPSGMVVGILMASAFGIERHK